ncbi:MAG: glycosyltransferase [Anaerolineae bacterium]
MSATGGPVSVVVTVRNEAGSIERLLDSLAEQSRRPDEVVVSDGGSSDGTLALLEERAASAELPMTVLSVPGANISAGRNAAIAAASGPIIACTDAGVTLPTGWLDAITEPFGEGARVVSGFFESDPRGPFETALGATTLPTAGEIDPDRFLPSSRSVAFLRSAWQAADGYPEWLDYGEDLVFDTRVLAAAGPAAFAPDAVVMFRPRRSIAAFARQYYLYARGDGKANLWPLRHAARYATYLALVPAVLVLAVAHSPLWLLVLVAGAARELATPYRRLVRQWRSLSSIERLQAALWVPVIRVTGDVFKMVGYPVGVAWRLRSRPPAWRPAAGRGGDDTGVKSAG